MADKLTRDEIQTAPSHELERWAMHRPDENDRSKASEELERRFGADSASLPASARFDRYCDISADAKYIAARIVKHLWFIFVLLPVVLAILWALLK